MAFANSLTQSRGARLSDRFAALAADWRDRRAKRRLYIRTRDELSQLGDRELSDLGLSRSMIRRIAWQAAYEG